VAGCGEQRIGKPGLPIVREQAPRQVRGSITVNEPPDLIRIARPEEMMRGCRRAPVCDQCGGRMLLQEFRIPVMPHRQSVDLDLAREAIARVASDLIQKRRPEGLCLALSETLEQHGNLEHVVATEHELFAPVRTE
jgi:hypothetical protein